ncbi:STR8 [Symbiodinium natans]|uniref:STR8 protein n=1 Tax=Symbiodinium natans TaxID=878477 RepID=A0A812NFL3_9DINO|nr:STR8 [Symbiodinium natans]
MPILLRSCCEYEAYLGEESVERSILALTTQFDLVAITERLSEGLVTLGRMYGLSASEIAAIGRRVGHKNEGSRRGRQGFSGFQSLNPKTQTLNLNPKP